MVLWACQSFLLFLYNFPMQRFSLPILFCLAVAYLSFFFQLGNLLFVGADEPRYARIGWEMLQRNDFVTPTLNGRPWLEKPPLLFWLEAVSYRVFGMGEGAARLPAAFLALLGCTLTAVLGRRIQGDRVAFLSFLVLATSVLYFGLARAASTDMPMTALLTASVVAGWLALERGSAGWAAWAGFFLGLAALAKGPVALLLFGGIFLLERLVPGKREWSRLQLAALVLLFLLTAFPWYWLVWKENGSNFILTFWVNHHLARFVTDLHHHSQPFWFYVPVLLLGFFPWVFFLPSGLIRISRSLIRKGVESERQIVFLWCWALLPFLFFSLSSAKLPGYILPSLPPMALLVALEWDRFLKGELRQYRFMKFQLTVQQAFTVVVAGVLLFTLHLEYDAGAVGGLVALPLLAAAGGSLWEFHRGGRLTVFVWLVGCITLGVAVTAWQAAPAVQNFHSAGALAAASRPLISEQNPLVLYRYFHHTAHYYADYQTTPEAVESIAELTDYMKSNPQPYYLLLTKEEGRREIRESFHPELLGHTGKLFLLRIEGVETGGTIPDREDFQPAEAEHTDHESRESGWE